jgi:hypothetical protein
MEDTHHDALTRRLPKFQELVGNVGLIPICGSPILRVSEEYLFQKLSRDDIESTLAIWNPIATFIEQLYATGGYTKFWIQDFCLHRTENEAKDGVLLAGELF